VHMRLLPPRARAHTRYALKAPVTGTWVISVNQSGVHIMNWLLCGVY
jgi:hypothetical protein